LQAVLHLFDLARPLGIYFNVVLFEDYDKPPYVNQAVLEKVVLPRYTTEELHNLPPHRARFLVEKRLCEQASHKYTDPDVLACQKDYLADLLPYLAPREEIFCYELENEMVQPPMRWVNEITEYIRRIDPNTLVLGNPGPHEWPEPWRWRDARVDLFSYHPYNDGQPDADHGAIAFMRSKWAAASGIPMFTGEGGINQNRWQRDVSKVPPAYAARGIRDQIWFSLCCGANGAFMWTASHDLEMAEFAKVLPALAAVGIDLTTLERARPRTAVLMPKDASANARAYVLAWRLLSLGIDFDVLPQAETNEYSQRLDCATADPRALDLRPDILAPGDGYQLAYLSSKDLSQVLVYLRNVAGGIVNLGDGRACYLRDPQPAQATLRVVPQVIWSRVKAYDLDDAKQVAVTQQDNGQAFLISASTTHDFIVGLSR
jgi:hypothetical protein